MRIIQTFTVPMSLCFLEGQARFWQENGHELHILTAAGDELVSFGHRYRVSIQAISFRRSSISYWQDLKSLYQLVCYFRKYRPDIVHGNTPKAALLTMIAARLTSVPTRIYEIHGLPLETASFWGKIMWQPIEKISCSLATRVIAVSSSLRQSVIKHRLVAPTKIVVIHHGSCNGIDSSHIFSQKNIDFTTIEFIRRELGLIEENPTVGFVGRLCLAKGIQELYKAWQIVKAHVPDAKLILIGEEDTRKRPSKKLLNAMDKDPTILRIGQRHNIATYYTLMDFLVLPSYREGLGNVVLEAAAMGKPAIVSDVTGLQDAVVADETGIFCQPRSIQDLVEKILFYLQNPAIRHIHGIKAQKRVQTYFQPQAIWQAKKALYTDLAEATNSVPLQYVSPILQTTH
ncbi:MAG: glycosyltransferase family 4 protein [Spirosomataceae bacterium]